MLLYHVLISFQVTQVDSDIFKRSGSKGRGWWREERGAKPSTQGVSSTKLQNSCAPGNDLKVTKIIKYILLRLIKQKKKKSKNSNHWVKKKKKKPMWYFDDVCEASFGLYPGVEGSGPGYKALRCLWAQHTCPKRGKMHPLQTELVLDLPPILPQLPTQLPEARNISGGKSLAAFRSLPRCHAASVFKMRTSCCHHMAPGEELGSGLESRAALPAQHRSRGN